MKSVEEKVCILMLDEMIIDAGVCHQPGDNYIIGFKDSGKERTTVLANHVNVFLLKVNFCNFLIKSVVEKDCVQNARR